MWPMKCANICLFKWHLTELCSSYRFQSIKSGDFRWQHLSFADIFIVGITFNFQRFSFPSLVGMYNVWLWFAGNELPNFRCEFVHFKINDMAVCQSKWLGQYNSQALCVMQSIWIMLHSIRKLNICMRRWRFIVFNWIPSWWFYTQGNGMICIYLFILSVFIFISLQWTHLIYSGQKFHIHSFIEIALFFLNSF